MLAALFLSISPAALAQLPDGLAERVKVCAGCHGPDGNSSIPGTPSIAGQPRVFLETQLVLIREGLRGAAVMQSLLKGLTDSDLIGLSRHYAALPARPAGGEVDRTLAQRGRTLAGQLRCGICHLKDFRGQAQVPRLAGQGEDYLRAIMTAFRDNPPPGGDTQMTAVLYRVADADIRALAHFLATYR